MARLCVLLFLAVSVAMCASCAVAQEKKVAEAEKPGGEQAGVIFAGEAPEKPGGEHKGVISIEVVGEEEEKSEAEHTVYVPYKELEKVFEKSGRGVFLPYEEFLQLWQKAKELEEFRALPPVAAVITGASYECLIKQDEDIATVKSTFAIDVLEKGWVQLPLALSGIALQEVKLDGVSALLSARQNDYLLILKEKGTHTLEANFAVKLDKRPDQRILSFGVVRTPVSRFALTIAEPDLDVEIEPKLLATKTVTPDGQKTEVLAFVGSTDKISVIYRPKPKEAVVLAGLFFSTVSTHILFSERLITAQSRIDYEILQKLNRLEVKLPSGWNLLSVTGADIRDWQIEGEGADRVLRVDLFTEAKNSYSLSLRLEMGIEKAEGTFSAPALSVVGAARESGYIALAVSEGLRIKAKETENVSQVDESELPASARRGKVDLAFRYLRHPYKLSVELFEVKPKITLRNDSLVTVTPEFVTLSCALRYTVERRGIFSVKIELPKNYTVVRCGDPSFVKDYRVKDGEKIQTLEVDFTTRLSGAFTLYLLLQSPRKAEEEAVPLPFAHDTACEKESGFIGICVKTNLKVTTEESLGLTPIDVSEFLSQVGDLKPEPDCPLSVAYQFFRYPVSAKFKVEKQKPKVVATVLTQLSFEESLLKVQTTIKYTILYAGIRKLKFSIADKIGETAHISGASIKEKKFTTEGDVITWDIELQGDTLGEYLLSVSYDIKIAPTAQTPITVAIPELTVLDLFEDQENGYFALCKKETLLVNAEKSAGLELIDVKELPDTLARALPYESYKYIAHPYSLSFSVLKQEFEKPLPTVVNHMHIESELSKEFVATSKMVCLIQSKTRQFLTFVLPPNSTVFKLYVNRKEAKRSVDPTHPTPEYVLINLSEYAPTETEFPVEIVYQTRVSEKKEMSCYGYFETVLPAVEEDVPVCRLTARLYLPRQFKYTNFSGNMRRIGAPEEERSLWFWGKSLLFPPAREQASDVEILRQIDAICGLFATGADMITVQLTGEGERFTFIKQGSGAKISVTCFARNFFWALDIVILLVTLAGLLLIARIFWLPRIAVSLFAILLFLILATLSRGAAREFLNTAFFGSLIASLVWFVSYVVTVGRERRYLRESRLTVTQPPEEPAPEKEKPQETPPGAQEEKGGESNE
jgi:hypothetical protein